MASLCFDAVLFDCDGVLVDSEPLRLHVLRDMLAELGWHLSPERCKALFLGRATADDLRLIEARTGKKPSQDWIDAFQLRRNQALRQHLVAVPSITSALQWLRAQGIPIACASAGEKDKIELQLRQCMLIDYFDGHLHSGVDLPRNKPHPDVYLAAAQGLGVDPKRCAIIEDSAIGIRAAVASGATVFAYCPHYEAETAIANGAQAVFHHMQQLPDTLLQYCRLQSTA
ncbi:MAG TPA: HAD family phosphatase [Candidatus Paenalcaligenes intestinipullorum]|uniref:HAD family phosphatase n=1 Tax=Candidatus Paenalcaligenes intestinipullorum TaxID=2838718 RepID=A0A9D2ZP83_9BURK|nr:HAD family phosphatase [Candidatus Paenalcaligenes intestinipullorum]